MSQGAINRVLSTRYADGESRPVPDDLVVEEPLEIHLDGTLVATTMRTPDHDFELAAGFCFTDGRLDGAPVQSCRHGRQGPPTLDDPNVVSVDTGGLAPVGEPRLSTASSSCGLCGSTSIDELTDRLQPLGDVPAWSLDVLVRVPDAVRPHQELFARTGAVHAAATFDLDGSIGVVREDIGRHNAVDKVVGHLLMAEQLPARDLGLYVSGRASFEMVVKAWAAGFSALVAVSAPSALAVATARRAGLLLAGFARDGRMNVYSPEALHG
ncbi:MAG: formate dehydrogenase accessory sulfurtransferase FdhD [Acidimicrobiia bacterium]|nr:formate dehydrogenase accessory sulfurtransferase FdhD [Acidimicrobiia bacterium]